MDALDQARRKAILAASTFEQEGRTDGQGGEGRCDRKSRSVLGQNRDRKGRRGSDGARGEQSFFDEFAQGSGGPGFQGALQA